MSEAARTATAVAIACGASAAAVVSAAMRAGQTIFFPGEPPALASWTEHAAFTWRSLVALYAGGILAFAFRHVFVTRPTALAWTLRALPACFAVAAALLALQAAFAP